MSNNLTILIPTSPIPSHPSTEILDETIANIRKYTDAKIILMVDGVAERLSFRTEDYDKYKERLKFNINNGQYGNCKYIDFVHHRHQSEMMKQALKLVDTDLVFFVEHDTFIGGDIPFREICKEVSFWGNDIHSTNNKDNYYGMINYVRFNIFDRILPEHEHLMIGTGESNGIPFTHTIQWSQRPHIAKTKWYKDILWTYFKEGERMMIEDRMHGIVQQKYKALGFDTFGLYIYTPPGDQTRSFTSDGRKDDPKIIEA